LAGFGFAAGLVGVFSFCGGFAADPDSSFRSFSIVGPAAGGFAGGSVTVARMRSAAAARLAAFVSATAPSTTERSRARPGSGFLDLAMSCS